MLKHGTDKLIGMLTGVINRSLNGEGVPQQWIVAYISFYACGSVHLVLKFGMVTN
jgi:hypothetical protein